MPNESVFPVHTEELDFNTYLSIDIEHNGSKGENDQVLEVAVVAVCDGQIVNKHWQRIHLHCKFNKSLTERLGLREEDYLDPTLPSEEVELKNFRFMLGELDLISHDIDKDLDELNGRFEKYHIDFLKSPRSDTQKIFKDVYSGIESKLEFAAEYLDLGEFKPHNAMEDAIMHARVYEWLMHHRILKG